jgi:hypothetical protein
MEAVGSYRKLFINCDVIERRYNSPKISLFFETFSR